MRMSAECSQVSKALTRRVSPPAGSVARIIASTDYDYAYALACMLDANAVHIGISKRATREQAAAMEASHGASFANAERIMEGIEKQECGAPVQLYLLTGETWTSKLLSAAGARPWPRVFQPLDGLSQAARNDYVRRAIKIAGAGRAVMGLLPTAQGSLFATGGGR